VDFTDTTRSYRIGDWRVDPALDEIESDGRRVKLEPRLMRLLCCLAARAGQAVSVEELLDQVWSGVVVSQGSVYQAVAHLRRLMDDSESPPRYIATVPRKGYRLVAAVCPGAASPGEGGADAASSRFVEPGAASPVSSTIPAELPARAAARRNRRRSALAAIVAAAAAAVALILSLREAPPAPSRGTPTVAVLPFADLSADGSDTAFCEGLTDELLNSLARLPDLRVIGQSDTARYRSEPTRVREVGSVLGVTHVLEGSVRRSGGRLRVSAQLVSTADGFQVWANSFDRPSRDVILIQTQIARAVADALASHFAPHAGERLRRAPVARVNAYDLYLLGRHQRLRRSADGLAQAVEYYKAALEADPAFALAHAGLADAYLARRRHDGRSLEGTATLVQAEIDAALRLDPELAEGYAAWAALLAEQGRTREAIAAAERALAIDSSNSEGYLRLGFAQERTGRLREALASYDQAATLDPLNTDVHVRRCIVLGELGRHEEADRACERGFELQPGNPDALCARALNAQARGQLVAAVRLFRSALARTSDRPDIRGHLASVYLDLGMYPESAAEYRRARRRDDETSHALAQGSWLLATGDRDGLRRVLSGVEARAREPQERIDAAFLALAAGDAEVARRMTVARPGDVLPSAEWPGLDLERIRWGMCDPCTVSVLQRRAGGIDASGGTARTVAAALDQLERQGLALPGLHYARAGLLAQQGWRNPALDSLHRAVDLGWRRAWYMRVDPALESLRGEPRFAALVARIEADNLHSRREFTPRTAGP